MSSDRDGGTARVDQTASPGSDDLVLDALAAAALPSLVDQLPAGAALVLAPDSDDDLQPPPLAVSGACALCGQLDPPAPWNLLHSVTSFSRTPLAVLLCRLCPVEAEDDGERQVCDSCAVLLNTVDKWEAGLAEVVRCVRHKHARRRRPTPATLSVPHVDGCRQRVRLVPIHTEVLLHPPSDDVADQARSLSPLAAAPDDASDSPGSVDALSPLAVAPDDVCEPSPPAGQSDALSAHPAGPGAVAPSVPPTRRHNVRRTGEFAHVTLTELTAVRRQCCCLLCGARQPNNGELRRHYRQSHRERPYTCPAPLCGKQLPGKSQLEKHWGYHLRDRPFHCRHCPKKFCWLSALEEHLHSHRGTKPYPCGQCSKRFRHRGSRTYHVRSAHQHRLAFSCTTCLRVFATKAQLDKHALMHTGERPHRCALCFKGFTQRNILQKHVLGVHKDDMVCTCDHRTDGHTRTCPARNRTAGESAAILEVKMGLHSDAGLEVV